MPLRFLGGTTKEDIGVLGEHFFHLMSEDPLNNGATEYNGVNIGRFHDGAAAHNPCWRAAEGDVFQGLCCNITVVWAGVLLSGAAGAGADYAFTLRCDGADTAVVIHTGAGAGGNTGRINVNISPAGPAGYLSWKCVPSGAPNVVNARSIVIIYRRNFKF
jgi:hypothetical protein